MCGVAGIFNYRERMPVEPTLLRAMAVLMAHRGPDGEGVHVDGEVGLASRRLAVVDLAGGAQPIANEDGSLWIVFNGEIYNHVEVRRRLEGLGHVFRTRCDTEVALHAFEQWDLDGLERLDGVFGLAVWNAAERRLVVARDPFGVKPLYCRDDGRSLIFASEIRPILRVPGVPRCVDKVALEQFLAYRFVPAPRTAFAGIDKVPPGCALVADRNGVVARRYHRRPPGEPNQRPFAAVADELAERLEGAVRRQMVADVPVGVMLSGGIDSGAVASIMVRAADGPVESFTVGFADDFEEDERRVAADVAARLGTEHHETSVGAEDFLERLPTVAWMMEEPLAAASTQPFLELCRLARTRVTVALSGQGADEPFGGYERAKAERWGSLYRLLPAPLRRALLLPAVGLLPRSERLKRGMRGQASSDPLERMVETFSISDERVRMSLLGGKAGSFDVLAVPVRSFQQDVEGLDGLAQLLYVDARFNLADNLLLYTDKLSMAASLEARVPFLDLDLMEFAECIPPRMKVSLTERKRVLKAAAARWLPAEQLQRRKIGFSTPFDEWFRGTLAGPLERRLLRAGGICDDLVDGRAVRGLLDEHVAGRENRKWILFALLSLDAWREAYIERSLEATLSAPPSLASVASSAAG